METCTPAALHFMQAAKRLNLFTWAISVQQALLKFLTTKKVSQKKLWLVCAGMTTRNFQLVITVILTD